MESACARIGLQVLDVNTVPMDFSATIATSGQLCATTRALKGWPGTERACALRATPVRIALFVKKDMCAVEALAFLALAAHKVAAYLMGCALAFLGTLESCACRARRVILARAARRRARIPPSAVDMELVTAKEPVSAHGGGRENFATFVLQVPLAESKIAPCSRQAHHKGRTQKEMTTEVEATA